MKLTETTQFSFNIGYKLGTLYMTTGMRFYAYPKCNWLKTYRNLKCFQKKDKEENEAQKLYPVQFSVGFSSAGG